MTRSARQHRMPLRPWALWFALFVAWAGAIVPTVSHALTWSRGGAPGYLTICSTAGPATTSATVPGQQDGTGNDTGTAGGMLHCPFCLHASDRAAPPPHIVAAGLLPPTAQPYLVVGHTPTHFSPLIWDAAPRGPPVLS